MQRIYAESELIDGKRPAKLSDLMPHLAVIYDGSGRLPYTIGGQGDLYLVTSPSLLKVGWTTDMRRRLTDLRRAEAGPFTVERMYRPINTKVETRFYEGMLLELFEPWKRKGEWFELEALDAIFAQEIARKLPEKDWPKWARQKKLIKSNA